MDIFIPFDNIKKEHGALYIKVSPHLKVHVSKGLKFKHNIFQAILTLKSFKQFFTKK